MLAGTALGHVTAIIPCFNEEEAIGPLVTEVLARGIGAVIVVDGGSSDATVEHAQKAGAQVIIETARGYGRACAAGVAAVARAGADILVFLDGDGSDDPSFIAQVTAPIIAGEADFAMGSRLRGAREAGSLSMPQIIAGKLAGILMRLVYGVQFTDMSPFRAIKGATLASLGMREMTFGWNLEMQMRVAARGLRIKEMPVGCRIRRGGVSKVSGNVGAALPAAWTIMRTFVRLALTLRRG